MLVTESCRYLCEERPTDKPPPSSSSSVNKCSLSQLMFFSLGTGFTMLAGVRFIDDSCEDGHMCWDSRRGSSKSTMLKVSAFFCVRKWRPPPMQVSHMRVVFRYWPTFGSGRLRPDPFCLGTGHHLGGPKSGERLVHEERECCGPGPW